MYKILQRCPECDQEIISTYHAPFCCYICSQARAGRAVVAHDKYRKKTKLLKLWTSLKQYVYFVDEDQIYLNPLLDKGGWYWETPDSNWNGPFETVADAHNNLFDSFCLEEGHFASRAELRRFKQSMLDSGAHI